MVRVSATFAPATQLSLLLSAFPKPDLLQNSDKQLVYVVLDSARCLYELAVT
jgi:hypothetical protein